MAMMSPRERFIAALRREPVDRQPVHFWNMDPFVSFARQEGPFYHRLALYARSHTESLAHWEQG